MHLLYTVKGSFGFWSTTFTLIHNTLVVVSLCQISWELVLQNCQQVLHFGDHAYLVTSTSPSSSLSKSSSTWYFVSCLSSVDSCSNSLLISHPDCRWSFLAVDWHSIYYGSWSLSSPLYLGLVGSLYVLITIGELSSNSLNPVHGEGELINVTGVEFYYYWGMEMKPKVIDYTI